MEQTEHVSTNQLPAYPKRIELAPEGFGGALVLSDREAAAPGPAAQDARVVFKFDIEAGLTRFGTAFEKELSGAEQTCSEDAGPSLSKNRVVEGDAVPETQFSFEKIGRKTLTAHGFDPLKSQGSRLAPLGPSRWTEKEQ